MKRIEYESIEDFVYEVCEDFEDACESKDFAMFSIIAKQKEASEIIKELVYADCRICNIELYPEYEDEYEEYLIDIAEGDDNTVEICCEPMTCGDGIYLNVYSDMVYVIDNCSSACLKFIHDRIPIEVGICDEDDDNECCDCCDREYNGSSTSVNISREKDGTPSGFTKSWSKNEDGFSHYSSYSYFSSDIDSLREIASKFDVSL